MQKQQYEQRRKRQQRDQRGRTCKKGESSVIAKREAKGVRFEKKKAGMNETSLGHVDLIFLFIEKYDFTFRLRFDSSQLFASLLSCARICICDFIYTYISCSCEGRATESVAEEPHGEQSKKLFQREKTGNDKPYD